MSINECVFLSPLERVLADKTVVPAVKMLDQRIAHIERESASDGAHKHRTDALRKYAVRFHVEPAHFLIEFAASGCGEVRDRGDEIRMEIADLAECRVIACRDAVPELLRTSVLTQSSNIISPSSSTAFSILTGSVCIEECLSHKSGAFFPVCS